MVEPKFLRISDMAGVLQGPQGIPGGILTWRGLYSAGTTYAANDGVISSEGRAFYCLQATTGNAPPSYPTLTNAYWSLFAEKGMDGGFDIMALFRSGFYYNASPNPQFQVNQRGLASYTNATVPANNDDQYLIDQVNLLSDGNNIVSVAPLAGNGMSFTQVTINKKSGYIKFLENKDAIKFAGMNVSFQIKAAYLTGHAYNNIRVAILTRTGTADSLTSDPVSAWGAQGVTPTWIAEWTCANTPANFGLTNAYQTFKVENVAIPAGITNLAYMVWIDDTNAAVGDVVYFQDEQLNEGPICLPFMPRAYAETLTQCRRFLRCWGGSTYERIGNGACHTATQAFVYLPFDVPMRIAPIIASSSAANTFQIEPGPVVLTVAPTIDSGGTTAQGVNFSATVASGLTAGHVATLDAAVTVNMYLRITAEL